MLHVPFISKVEFSSYLIVVLKRGAKTTRQCVDNLQISDTLYAVDFKISSCNKKSYDNGRPCCLQSAHGTYIRWLLKNRSARRDQSVIAFDWIKSSLT